MFQLLLHNFSKEICLFEIFLKAQFKEIISFKLCLMVLLPGLVYETTHENFKRTIPTMKNDKFVEHRTSFCLNIFSNVFKTNLKETGLKDFVSYGIWEDNKGSFHGATSKQPFLKTAVTFPEASK